jgi:hypothetical protein
VDPALALEHFEEDGHHGLVALGHALDRGEVVVGNAHEAAHQRLEARLRLARAGGRERGERAAVPGLLHHDDRGVLDAALVAVEARELDRALVRLGAGVGEEDVVHLRERAEALGELLLLRHAEVVGRVDQLGELVLHALGEHGMRVAQPVHGDPGERVQVALAVRVEEVGALAARERDGIGVVRVHHVLRAHCRVDLQNGKRRPRAAVLPDR